MSMHDPRPRPSRPAVAAGDDWVPEDRAPSAAENNFMSFVLFAFLILFGISCFILF
ncbi:hypothetical protein [Ornithinimicrobium pratense]|uniref:hypothetical protein n=1 Tax=Ornithinimicrobium pratense TaxID=2593973 RepID=UPI00178853ED|nr:hypothetical protein [Ornithinimicrobium pratense]